MSGLKNKGYVLGNCTTWHRIRKEISLPADFPLQEIKTEKILPDQLDEMAELAGSYEALFSRIAMKYRSMGLKDKNLGEKDYRKLILEEYTFLKRPVFIIGEDIYIGNSKKNVESLKKRIKSLK